MKNEYFADINDYRKYGLLRCFIEAGFSLGVCWMLTPDTGGKDGQKTAYLDQAARWRMHDPHLFDFLATTFHKRRRRSVSHIEKSGLLPNTRFMSEILRDSAFDRQKYISSMQQRLAGTDLIFFDPDNGIEVRSVMYGARRSAQYLYWNEIESVWPQGSSLLIYQHFPRERRSQYTARLLTELQERTATSLVAAASTANVLFLFAGHAAHRSRFNKAATLIKQRWANQITLSLIDSYSQSSVHPGLEASMNRVAGVH